MKSEHLVFPLTYHTEINAGCTMKMIPLGCLNIKVDRKKGAPVLI